MGMDLESLTEATSGAIGGLLSTTILYPLDICNTKFQAEAQSGENRKYSSLSDVLWEALSSGKISSLYQGLGTKNLYAILSQFIYFYSYSYFKKIYLLQSRNKTLCTGANLLAAAGAAACTIVITHPLDTASAGMQTCTFGKSKGLWGTLTGRSWKDAFDGLGASLLLVVNPAIQFTLFEQLKQRSLQNKHGKRNPEASSPAALSAFAALLLGAISKSVATVVTYPVVRCKVMIQAVESNRDAKSKENGEVKEKGPKGMVDALRIIWQREGILGFYKGLQIQILKTVSSASLLLMIKEKISRNTWIIMAALTAWIVSGWKRIK